jgi:hypothetical protein
MESQSLLTSMTTPYSDAIPESIEYRCLDIEQVVIRIVLVLSTIGQFRYGDLENHVIVYNHDITVYNYILDARPIWIDYKYENNEQVTIQIDLILTCSKLLFTL